MSFLGGQYLPEWQTNRGSVCPRIGGQYPPEWGVSLLRIIQQPYGCTFLGIQPHFLRHQIGVPTKASWCTPPNLSCTAHLSIL